MLLTTPDYDQEATEEAMCQSQASAAYCYALDDVREKMVDLARMEAVLSELVGACHSRQGNVSCPLIASLQGEASLTGAPSLIGTTFWK